MIAPQPPKDEGQAPSTNCQGFRQADILRTALFCSIAALLGGLGWSGRSSLNYFALLYPFVYLHSRQRLDSLSATFYYAAATWSVIPASHGFFRTGANPIQPLLTWISLIALSSAPWVVLYNRQFLSLSAITSLVLLAVPPLGLVTVAHPLIAAGHWFPGSRWFGLALPIALLAGYRRFGSLITLAVLLAASLIGHARFHRPLSDPLIVAIDTDLGGQSEDPLGLDSQAKELVLQHMALAHPDSLVLLPESVLPGWSPVREAHWSATFALLREQHTGLLIGTTIPIANTEANRNVLLSRGYTERLSYVQRVPVPLGMWQFGEDHQGLPLMLRFPATIRVWNRRAGVLICYEQFLVWPALQTLARNPDILLAPSNLYWASGTPVPAIQHVSAQDWADLWAIPLYEASNR